MTKLWIAMCAGRRAQLLDAAHLSTCGILRQVPEGSTETENAPSREVVVEATPTPQFPIGFA